MMKRVSMQVLYREYPIAHMCPHLAAAERDGEGTYRRWLLSGVFELIARA